jgi:hypothetical protein
MCVMVVTCRVSVLEFCDVGCLKTVVLVLDLIIWLSVV